tara:strand:- start:2792 stop:5284 length:2493 start_codon:yes stop_codon:yes gene_type:complete
MLPRMRRVLLAATSSLALTALAPAQHKLVGELESKLATMSVGTVAWYQTSLDRVAALWRYDLELAVHAGEQLWTRAKDDGPLGVAEAAAARVAIAMTEYQGANAAAVWGDRAQAPPLESELHIQADYFLTRARTLCLLGKHADEVPLAIKSQACAEKCGDWVRRIEALIVTLDVVPNRRLAGVRRMLREATDAGDESVAYLQPAIAVIEADYHVERGDVQAAKDELEIAENMARLHGNRTVLAEVALSRASLAEDAGDLDQAAKLYVLAGDRYREMNDFQGVVLAMDLRAEVAILQGDVVMAEALIQQELDLMSGRGWVSLEQGVLVTQFNLAIKQEDGPRASHFLKLVDEADVVEHEESVRFFDVSEALASKEMERAEMERKLNAERLAFAEQSQAMWMWSAIAGVLGLGALLAVSWVGRRRLLAANRQLAEKIDQVNEALAAKGHLEERVGQMQRAEGLGTLAAGIAHDFNNLLTSMISGAELLRAQDDEPERRELADMILAAGQQGSRLCRQLQSYSGGAPLTREPFDLRQIVVEMVPTLVSSVKGQIEVQLQQDSQQIVALVDRGQFEQILLNLVMNSSEAGASNIWISIREAGIADESNRERTRMAILSIVDDGSGMSAEVAERIFDPFFTTKFPGRGLGLAVVFGVVRRHGGHVTVDSPDRGGARFTIHLPMAAKDVVLPRPPAKLRDTRDDLHIPPALSVLIVDDEPIVRLALTSMLRKMGITAHAFDRGADAVAFVGGMSAKQPCIAFVDLTMPEMDGTEVIRQLRVTGRPVSCVLMSGHADDYVDECARQLNPDRLLAKPFMMEEVRQVMMELTAEMHPVT